MGYAGPVEERQIFPDPDMDSPENGGMENEPARIPVGPELDLHSFPPRHVAGVVAAWIEECHEIGIHRLRIIHGKGMGNLRRTVHHVLAQCALIESYQPASEAEGSWGATIAYIRIKPEASK
ncbi:MAG: Smr/MutS family protein [Verrucomicrobia bacterium]|nr:Smr/MutS family protein [Verrucomicrobiota bacterium]